MNLFPKRNEQVVTEIFPFVEMAGKHDYGLDTHKDMPQFILCNEKSFIKQNCEVIFFSCLPWEGVRQVLPFWWEHYR